MFSFLFLATPYPFLFLSSPAFRPDYLVVHWIAGRLWGGFFPRAIGSFREACGEYGSNGVIGRIRLFNRGKIMNLMNWMMCMCMSLVFVDQRPVRAR